MKENSHIRRGNHCVWQIHYHIVFPVKYRKVLLEARVIEVIRSTSSERYAIEIEGLGMDLDHVHLLCSAHPTMSVGSIVRIYKSITARAVFREVPEVKRELWGGEFWSDGYYVGTVGDGGNWIVVEKYVKEQGKPKEELKQLSLF